MSLPVSTVMMRDADAPFVLHTWLRSYRGSPWVQGIESDVYYRRHHVLAERLIGRSLVFVAAWDKNPDQVYGWVCGDRVGNQLVLHYLYVKSPFRRHGIGRMLMGALGYAPGEKVTCTHRTWADGPKGFASRVLRFEYDPYMAYEIAYAN